MKRFSLLVFFVLLLSCLIAAGCDDDDDDDNDSQDDDASPLDDDSSPADDDDNNDQTSPPADDDDDDDNDDNDNDDNNDDNDDDDNDDNDDLTPPPDVENPARAAGFKLFYRERLDRLMLAWNRFGLVGDAAFGTNIHKHFIAKAGDEYEVLGGESDNNDLGVSIWSAWHAYRNFGGRNLELTLIRQFEGLAFYEAITGHPGITSREVIPGWTRLMDGVNDQITRTRDGEPFTPPVVFSGALEQEILDAFYDGIVVNYRENPYEYYQNFKPRGELTGYAVTYVFSDWEDWLHVSNCCSSWMETKLGIWQGAYWGNHNSRDNFPDMSLGFLAAYEAAKDETLPEDLSAAVTAAVEAGHRIGDRIVADSSIQMTVDEHHDYDTLVPGGQVRPDGRTEWQDLGSLASCTTVYLAKAISTEGLDVPLPELPMPGAIETSAIYELLRLLGFEDIVLPVLNCTSIDDAFVGLTWGELLDLEVFGVSWIDLAYLVAELFPELLPELLGKTGDDFKEMEMGAMALCYYSQINEKDDLLRKARRHLSHLLEMHYILADLAYTGAAASRGAAWEGAYADLIKANEEHLYVAAFMANLCGLEAPLEDFDNFSYGESYAAYLESILNLADTAPWTLLTDEEIMAQIQAELDGKIDGEPWIVERYWARFPDAPPVRRAGDGYEAINAAGEWQAVENPWHTIWSARKLAYEAPLCTKAPWVLSCDWAALGCARPDLDDSGAVDAADQTLHETLLATYSGVVCNEDNTWCEGADLDRSGAADADDRDFMTAAQGCVR